MAGAKQFDCRIQELQHLVAALNALGVMLNIAARQIGRRPGRQNPENPRWKCHTRSQILSGHAEQTAPGSIPHHGISSAASRCRGTAGFQQHSFRQNFFMVMPPYLFSTMGLRVSSKLATCLLPHNTARPKRNTVCSCARGSNSSRQSPDKGYNL